MAKITAILSMHSIFGIEYNPRRKPPQHRKSSPSRTKVTIWDRAVVHCIRSFFSVSLYKKMLKPSTRKNKKYQLVLDDQIIHFGQKGSQTYVEGASKQKREQYLKRHRVNEDWTRPNPGSASRYILWGDSRDIKKNLRQFLNSVA